MKVTSDRKRSNQKISNQERYKLNFWYCKSKRVIYFLLFSKAKWLVILSLFSQFINLADPVVASTNYARRTYTHTKDSRHCDIRKQSQILASSNKCVSSRNLTNCTGSDREAKPPNPCYQGEFGNEKNSLPTLFTGVGGISNVTSLPNNKKANNKKGKKPKSSHKSPICVGTNIETLMTQLLRDLPSYANRASQRARRLSRTTQTYTYMLMAGKPEFTPLPTSPIKDTENKFKKSQDKEVKQVFFTTLERQYIKGKPIQLQQFHRLFLTKAENGWQMVIMFTQTGSYPKNKPPTPPRDSTNGVVGQAIKTWLRDCRVADNKKRKS